MEDRFVVRLIESDVPHPAKAFLSLAAAAQFGQKRVGAGDAERAEIFLLRADGSEDLSAL